MITGCKTPEIRQLPHEGRPEGGESPDRPQGEVGAETTRANTLSFDQGCVREMVSAPGDCEAEIRLQRRGKCLDIYEGIEAKLTETIGLGQLRREIKKMSAATRGQARLTGG